MPACPTLIAGSDAGDTAASLETVRDIIDSMEQGVIVWSEDGLCEAYNKRIFDVLELAQGNLYTGLSRVDFLRMAADRGEFGLDVVEHTEARFKQTAPFSFDRKLPSSRVVVTTARPKASGGFVVTFTDVTLMRLKEAELADQKEKSERAESKAQEALALVRAREQDSRRLSQLGEWLQCCKSLEELLDIVSRFLEKLFPDSSGELYIYSNSRDVLDSACSWNHVPCKAHIEPDDCWSLRRGRMFTYGDDLIDMRCQHADDLPDDGSAVRYICIPIIAHGDTVGLLHIRFDADGTGVGDTRTETDRRDLVIKCSEQISLAVANVQLREELRDQSVKDPLTGLYNRRYFLDRCRRAMVQSERHGRPCGIVSLDADHFKTFNDNHGHDAGDHVLKSIASIMLDTFDDADVVARFGGEEFSILVTDADPEAMFHRAEQLRAAVEANTLKYGSETLPNVTISIGIASYPGAGRTPQELLKAADEAVYVSKDSGRNRVSVSQSQSD